MKMEEYSDDGIECFDIDDPTEYEFEDFDNINLNDENEYIRRDEIFRALEQLNIEDIEAFLRIKKLKRINKK